ncbi:hypothetical protein [Pandoraea pnomenusa]|uniref:hypothetical protein n=1 Tax=Pandoraea pnomenusa TaxID=93220 RepID=UPI0033403AC2
MVGVFIVMWMAALMTLAASGMQHRQLANRFVAYTHDRVGAFAAADAALAEARHWLTRDDVANAVASVPVFEAGPDGVLAGNHRDDVWFARRVPRWRTVDWHRNGAVAAAGNARYFIERIALAEYLTETSQTGDASRRRYRVSAMGCGKLPGTRVYLQAIYEVRRQVATGAGAKASPSFSSRLLSWREVSIWHDDTDGLVEPGRRREACHAS